MCLNEEIYFWLQVYTCFLLLFRYADIGYDLWSYLKRYAWMWDECYQRSCFLRLLRQQCFHKYTEIMFSAVSVTLNFLHVSVKAFDLRWFSKIHEDIRKKNQEEISIIQNWDINMDKMRWTDAVFNHGHNKRKGEGCAIKCIY